MEKYFAAKRLLFDGTVYPAPRVAVIQRARPAQRRVGRGGAQAGAEVRTYGIGEGDWRAAGYTLTPSGRGSRTWNSSRAAKVTFAAGRRGEHPQSAGCVTAAHRAAERADFRWVEFRSPALLPVPGRFQVRMRVSLSL